MDRKWLFAALVLGLLKYQGIPQAWRSSFQISAVNNTALFGQAKLATDRLVLNANMNQQTLFEGYQSRELLRSGLQTRYWEFHPICFVVGKNCAHFVWLRSVVTSGLAPIKVGHGMAISSWPIFEFLCDENFCGGCSSAIFEFNRKPLPNMNLGRKGRIEIRWVKPSSNSRDIRVGAFLRRIGRTLQLAGLIEGRARINSEYDKSGDLKDESWSGKFVFETLAKIAETSIAFVAGCVLVAFGLFVIQDEVPRQSKPEMAARRWWQGCGLIVLGQALVILALHFAGIFV
jgi:hypothetical protein